MDVVEEEGVGDGVHVLARRGESSQAGQVLDALTDARQDFRRKAGQR